MERKTDPGVKQMLDDAFDAFSMISGGNNVFLTHIPAGITRYSPGFVQLANLPGEYLPAESADRIALIHPEDRRRHSDIMAALHSGISRNGDWICRIRTRKGEYAGCRFAGAVMRDASGAPLFAGGIIVNLGLTENTDPVTGLRNKQVFLEDLNILMEDGVKPVILLVGISKLSHINRIYGYSYGNRVLQETTFLIQETVGSRGTVYRMDDAMFAFLANGLTRPEVAAIYDTLRLKMQRGIRIEGVRTILTANGGMIDTEHLRSDAGTVYSFLQYVYRESKLRRNGDLVDFNGSLHYDFREMLEMVNTIRDCIIEDCRGFYVDYQPVVSADTEKLVALEALIRWNGTPYGEVEPLRFLPILEKDFVFEELAEWILRQAARDGLRFLEKSPDLLMSVNVSPTQVEDEYFIDGVMDILRETGFPARNLCIEVTKDCRLLELERLQKVVDALHAQNIHVIIDDFGTGFESISFLKKLSADYIKFDRELVAGIEHNREDRQTMEYLSKMATMRGTHVCVKGVETLGMRDILRGFDVNSFQGNFYSRPEPFSDIMHHFFQ